MGAFEAVQYVTGIFSLVAFLAAAISVVFVKYISRKEGLIKSVPEEDRANLVEIALEDFSVDTSALTRQQKYDLLIQKMDHKAEQGKKTYRFLGLLTVVLAICFVATQKFGDPTRDFRRGMEIDELDRVMVSNYQQEMFGDAEEAADSILAIDPNHYRALSVKGSVAIYDGEPRTAVKLFKKGLENAPDSRALKRNLAYALIETGDFDQAIELYESINDGKTESVNSLGRAYLYGGQYEKALNKLQVIPNTYTGGYARILSSTALVLQSEAATEPERSQYITRAKEEFEIGYAQDPIYWRGILSGERENKNTTYRLEIEKLGQFLPEKS